MKTFSSTAALAVAIGLVLAPGAARSHCDSLDGPVVQDARRAIDKRDAAPVLKWVAAEREAEVREALQQALAVRGAGSKAKALADRHFFETVVRIHRAGEGEGFTGLKPAGSIEPGIAAADRALESGSADALAQQLSAAVSSGIRQRLARVLELRKHAEASVEAGREYVEAYVEYVHYVEGLERLASQGATHQHHESH